MEVIEKLKYIFDNNTELRKRMEHQIALNALDNPDTGTNPIRSLDNLYKWLDKFLSSMPWEAWESDTSKQSLFRRIDQKTGYFYYLFQDLQYEEEIAGWIQLFHQEWGKFLDSPASWNISYYELLKSDPLFQLETGKYESPANWKTFNDFFTRKLNIQTQPPEVAEGITYPWQKIKNNTLDIKTAHIENITDLLGDSRYKQEFENGRFMHITLDFYNYHHFHSPVDGKIVDIQQIDGALTECGKIIWDNAGQRYRYEQQENIEFCMLEKRATIVIEPKDTGRKLKELIAIIPIGIAQVGSIKLNNDIRIGADIRKKQAIGCFLCGGSEVVILTANKSEMDFDFAKLNKAIAEEYEVPAEIILPENDIRQTLELDSMRAMSMIAIVKRTTGVLINPRHLPRFTTFQSLYDYIEDAKNKS